jgi:hypothetical protein
MKTNNLKIGDKFNLATRSYVEQVMNNTVSRNMVYKEEYNCTVVYIIEGGGIILEVNEPIVDDTFDSSLFFGKEIKHYFKDFIGDDDKEYCIPYYENSPFYDD